MGTVFISYEACDPLLEDLRNEGHEIITVWPSGSAAPSIDAHPDIYMCRVGGTLMIDDSIRTVPDIRKMHEEALLAQIEDAAWVPLVSSAGNAAYEHIVFNMGNISDEYPYDVPYNAAVTDRYFIHNTAYTAPALYDLARERGMEIIRVKQGYSRCSCVIAGPDAVITADRGIASSIEAYNAMLEEEGAGEEWLDYLLVEQGHVELPGYRYGFIGGASGMIEGKVYFNGDLSAHPDHERICAFIEEHGCRPVWYPGEALKDIGSIVYLR